MQRLPQVRSSRTPIRNATGTQNQGKTPSNTAAFADLPWNAFSVHVNLFPTMGKVLKWKRQSVDLVTHVVGQMAGEETIKLPHKTLAAKFSPDRPVSSGKRQVGRAIKSTNFDMAASSFPALFVKLGDRITNSDKEVVGSIDTEYKQGMIRPAVERIQKLAIEADLLAMPTPQLNARLESIVRTVLIDEMKCKPVSLEQREEQKRRQEAKRKKKAAAQMAAIDNSTHPEPSTEEENDEDDGPARPAPGATGDQADPPPDLLIRYTPEMLAGYPIDNWTKAHWDTMILSDREDMYRALLDKIGEILDLITDPGERQNLEMRINKVMRISRANAQMKAGQAPKGDNLSPLPVKETKDLEPEDVKAGEDMGQATEPPQDQAITCSREHTTEADMEEQVIRQRKLHGLKASEPEFAEILSAEPLSVALDICKSDRLFLCGTLEEMSREYVEEPIGKGWSFAREYIHKFRSPVYKQGEREISVKLIGESWFPGCTDIEDASCAWYALNEEWRQRTGLPLLSTPSKTGQAFLWETLPKGEEYPMLSEDFAKHIRSISPQHRLETFKLKYEGTQYCYDGRWMYAALAALDRLPVGTPQKVTEFTPYLPGWYHITATIPENWNHFGILPVKDNELGWVYPSEPGITLTTWASEPELTAAQAAGWQIDVIEGWRFQRGRPLGGWAKKLIEMRESVRQVDEYAAKAIREILNHAIGSLHTIGYEREQLISDGEWREWLANNRGVASKHDLRKVNGGWIVPVIVPDKSPLAIHMPHWSAQIYALERARIAQHLLKCDPAMIISINGDAIYAADRLPISDNQNLGQLRLKEVING